MCDNSDSVKMQKFVNSPTLLCKKTRLTNFTVVVTYMCLYNRYNNFNTYFTAKTILH